MNSFYVLKPDYKLRLLLLGWLFCCHFIVKAALTCPPNQTITALPGACEAELDFNSLVWSSSNPLIDTLFSPGPGHSFPIGTTAVSLTGVEVGGNVVSCAFTVTVQNYDNPLMACDDNVPVLLGPDCTSTITQEMMLIGNYGCPSYFSVGRITPMGGFISPAVVDENDANDQVTIKVTNTLTGQACWGTVVVAPYSIPLSITCPPDTIINCNESSLPATTGEADYFSCLSDDRVTLTYLDSYTTYDCSSNLKFEVNRFWKVQDIYTNERFCSQNIKVRRNTLSDISFPNDIEFNCQAILADPSLTEPATAGAPLVLGSPLTVACGFSSDYEDLQIPLCDGSFKILRNWTIVDWCAVEVLQHEQEIKVLDTEAPSVNLADTIYISTNPICGLSANFPEAQVSDDCSSFEVVVTTPWDTLIGNGGPMPIINTIGSYSGSYTITDNCGNIAEHPITLQVQAGTLVACPPNTTIGCDFYLQNLEAAIAAGDFAPLSQMGEMQFYANCLVTPTQTVVVDVDDCHSGTIVRTMGAEELPDQCVQTITVVPDADFGAIFPLDLLIQCTTEPFDAGEPTLFGVGCGHVSVSYTDQVFNVVPDACYKIVRTWVVQNTCISTGIDTAPDFSENEAAAQACDFNGDGVCNRQTVKAGADGFISYQQVIKVRDDVAPVFVNGCTIPDIDLTGQNCTGTIVLPTPETEECSNNATVIAQIRINGIWLYYNQPIPDVPVGTYTVRYVAQDICNNQTQCMTTVTLKDNTPPSAVCQPNMVLELEQNGSLVFNAASLNLASTDLCSMPIYLSFSPEPSEFDTLLNCAQLGQFDLTMFAIDAQGNYSTCTTTIDLVEATGFECIPTALVGNITTETGQGVNNVKVYSYPNTTYTNSNGVYDLGETYNLPLTSIKPSLNTNFTNGVTTFDVVLLRRHILDVQKLDSPYKIIAADVNDSFSVSTFDMVLMTKLIIGEIASFPNLNSWRFVPKNFVFQNPDDPFSMGFPEFINQGFPATELGFDFTAIKVGDVNNSADPSLIMGPIEAKAGLLPSPKDD
ncbi:MAG: hypothetical protein IT258_00540 [Saprospiraceae bacterium]|nr:hypothetical protein [Saprospiraceae bacterium]